jgi:hypothetical protein
MPHHLIVFFQREIQNNGNGKDKEEQDPLEHAMPVYIEVPRKAVRARAL